LLTQAVAQLPEDRVQGPLDVHSQDEVR